MPRYLGVDFVMASELVGARRALDRLSSSASTFRHDPLQEKDREHHQGLRHDMATGSCNAVSMSTTETVDLSFFDDDPFGPSVDDHRADDRLPSHNSSKLNETINRVSMLEQRCSDDDPTRVKQVTLNRKTDEVSSSAHVVPVCLSSCRSRFNAAAAIRTGHADSLVPTGFLNEDDVVIQGRNDTSMKIGSADEIKVISIKKDPRSPTGSGRKIIKIAESRNEAKLRGVEESPREEIANLLQDLIASVSKQFEECPPDVDSSRRERCTSCNLSSAIDVQQEDLQFLASVSTRGSQDDQCQKFEGETGAGDVIGIIDLVSGDCFCSATAQSFVLSDDGIVGDSGLPVIILSDAEDDEDLPVEPTVNFDSDRVRCGESDFRNVNEFSKDAERVKSNEISPMTANISWEEIEEFNSIFEEDFHDGELNKCTGKLVDLSTVYIGNDYTVCQPNEDGDVPPDSAISRIYNKSLECFKKPPPKKSSMKFEWKADPLDRFLFLKLGDDCRIGAREPPHDCLENTLSTKETFPLMDTKPVCNPSQAVEITVTSQLTGGATNTAEECATLMLSDRPTEATGSSPRLLRIVCSSALTQNNRLMKLMENSHNITFVERNYDDPVVGEASELKSGRHCFSDIDLDERTAVLLRPLADLANVTSTKDLINLVIRFMLKYATCFVVLHGGGSSSLSQIDLAEVSQNLTKLYFTASFFSSKKHYGYGVKVLFAFGDRQLAETIRKMCDFALVATTVWDADRWIDRAWILDGMSAHERFLLRFPSINSFSAQVMLAIKSLQELLSLSLSELIRAVPWVPERCLKTFHTAAHEQLLLWSSSKPAKFNLDDDASTAKKLKVEDMQQFHVVEPAPFHGDAKSSQLSMGASSFKLPASHYSPLEGPVTLNSRWSQAASVKSLPSSAPPSSFYDESESAGQGLFCNSGIMARTSHFVHGPRQASNTATYPSIYAVHQKNESDMFCSKSERFVPDSPPMDLPSFTLKHSVSVSASTDRKYPSEVVQRRKYQDSSSTADKKRVLRYQRVPGNGGQTRLTFG